MLQIKNHKFIGVDFIPSPNVSNGTITPKFIVEHYTAGWTAESAINTFLNKESKVSSQLVVDRDGRITQMVPFNRKAWHAGPSRWAGYEYLNGHSIGIENANIGYLRRINDDLWADWKGKRISTKQLIDRGYDPRGFIEMAHPRLGSGRFHWPSYTAAQLAANDAIVTALCAAYPIEDILSHEEIDTRGWKTDPGPAFPMARYKAILRTGHRADREDGGAPITAGTYKVKVTVGSLNIRSGPGTKWAVFATLKRDDIRQVLDTDGEWLFLSLSNEREGWVHGRYTTRV